LLTGLNGPGDDERLLRLARGRDRALRPLVVVEAADPEQVVALLLAEREVPDDYRVADHRHHIELVRRLLGLVLAERDNARLVRVPAVEGERVLGEGPVERVEDRRVDAVRERERREATVV